MLFAFAGLAVASPVHGTLGVKHATVAVLVAGVAIALLVVAVLLAELVYKRRWAWIVFLVIYVSGLVRELFDFRFDVGFVIGAILIALLLSPPMRRHVAVARVATAD